MNKNKVPVQSPNVSQKGLEKVQEKMLDIKVEQTQKAKHRETHKVKEKPVNAVALY